MIAAYGLKQLPRSYIREILAAASQPDCLSLAGGLPSEQHFPMDIIRPTLASLGDNAAAFQYGNTRGYGPLLDFLQSSYGINSPEQMLISNGSQQGIDLIARAFINAGDEVVLEAPAYLGALQVFNLARAKLRFVTQLSTGPDLEELERCFSSGRCKLFYGVPDFHNPTGVCWDLATRQAVAQLCRRYGVLLVEDIAYRELRFSNQSLPLVSSVCPENALVLRSFSKIAMPGLRLACVTGPSQCIDLLIKIKQASDLHTNTPLQVLLLSLLSHHDCQAYLESLTVLYKSRYKVLTEALIKHLAQYGEFNEVSGGMFIWLRLKRGDDDKIAKRALDNGVAVVPGSVFYPANQGQTRPPQAALRLNFSHCDSDSLQEAVRRLAAVFERS